MSTISLYCHKQNYQGVEVVRNERISIFSIIQDGDYYLFLVQCSYLVNFKYY